MKMFTRITPVLVALLLVFTGCEDDTGNFEETPESPADEQAAEARVATATLEPTEGNEATGQVTFTEEPGGIRVVAQVDELPNTSHGFHIHENGDCSAPDASSAGGHFNPTDTPHGAPDDPAEERHVGDLGNIEAQDGIGQYDRVDDVLTFDGQSSIADKAVVVHMGSDDLESQPSGDAGDRIACGVIEMQDTQTDNGMNNLPNDNN